MSRTDAQSAFTDTTEADVRELFSDEDYIAGDDVVTTTLLALRLGKPLLIEGEPGSGKTELGYVLASGLDTELLRLQCYEGLTAENALYEWNYTKQLLTIEAGERDVADAAGADESVFSKEFLLERPLLAALDHDGDRPPVLLIDEIDRADEEFEALLLEVLSDFQVSVPEFGTVQATVPPVVIITSNRTRGLSDALKRRCLYLHIEPPAFEQEYEIVRRKVPELDESIAAGICRAVQRLREEPLVKRPGVSETLDWAEAVAAISDGNGDVSPDLLVETLGTVLKTAEDQDHADGDIAAEVRAAFAVGDDA